MLFYAHSCALLRSRSAGRPGNPGADGVVVVETPATHYSFGMGIKPVIGICGAYDPVGKKIGTVQHYHIAMGALYVDAIARAGGVPIILPPCENAALVPDMLERVDALLVPGGPDIAPQRYGAEPHPETKCLHPRREQAIFALVEHAQRRSLPVFGICLGIQVLNVARGGTLVQDIPSQVANAILHANGGKEPYADHPVQVVESTRLAAIVGKGMLVTNTSHHQAIARPGTGLIVAARAGDGVIEAVEDPTSRFFMGVQWHPERLTERPRHLALIEAFVNAARNGA